MASQGALPYAYLVDAPLPEVGSLLEALGYILDERRDAFERELSTAKRSALRR